MSENLRWYTKAIYGMDHVVRLAGSDPAVWDRPSPCTEWVARDVLGHVIAVQRSRQARLDGRERLEELPGAPLADREVAVSRLDRRLIGRVGHADAEPHADQRMHDLELGLRERPVDARSEDRGHHSRPVQWRGDRRPTDPSRLAAYDITG